MPLISLSLSNTAFRQSRAQKELPRPGITERISNHLNKIIKKKTDAFLKYALEMLYKLIIARNSKM